MTKKIRIGTRDSQLALWQAHTVQRKLEGMGYQTEIVSVKSEGDVVLDKPLYEFGITGIFTKTLDVAMIQGQIDIAVHSMKDVPTALPKGMVQGAVLERADVHDILVTKSDEDFYPNESTIATGSLRRQAQWKNRYPRHQTVDLRGNVNTRLQKLSDSQWQGAIFAQAGLERLEFCENGKIIAPNFIGNYTQLDWMIPAPAQGAMVITVMDNDLFSKEAVSKLNHQNTEICTRIEREFLRKLEGGCTAPIGAKAQVIGDCIDFKGVLLSVDGTQRIAVEKSVPVNDIDGFGSQCAQEILSSGGDLLMQQIREQLKK